MEEIKSKEDLILAIAKCKEITEKNAYKDKNHACNKVVIANKKKLDQFQCPEPFDGKIDKAEYLILSSNPAYDLKETTEKEKYTVENKMKFPCIYEKDKSIDDNYIIDFFYNRLSRYKNKTYLTNCMKIAKWVTASDDWAYSELTTKGKDEFKDEYRDKICLAEIVHCKSNKEVGVEEACSKCAEKYLDYILKFFCENKEGKKLYIILCGDKVINHVLDKLEIINKLNEYRAKSDVFIVKAYQPSYYGVGDKEKRKRIKNSIENQNDWFNSKH